MHCSYSVLGAWCRSHAYPKGSFKASLPQSKPYAISDPCPCSKDSLHVRCLHCLGVALALFVRRPHAACALHARCLCVVCTLPVCCHARCLCVAMRAACALPCALPVRCHAHCLCSAMRAACVRPCALPVRGHACLCALPCVPLCAAMRASVRCHARLYIRLWAICTSLILCPMFPLRPFAWPSPQGLSGVRPCRGHGPPFSLKTCSPLKEHYKPFSDFLEETSEWLRRYNRIFK